jgi:drug/metabolite transporter (DMT)-like permease
VLNINIVIYVVLTALSIVFIDKLGIVLDPMVSLFYMALFATLFFNLISFKTIKSVYIRCYQQKALYLLVAITVGINWLCSISAPTMSDPFIYIAAYFITLSMSGFVAELIKKNQHHYTKNIIGLIVFTLCLVLLYRHYSVLAGRSVAVGIVYGIVSGVSAYFYALFSNKLCISACLSSAQILAVRFWPLLAVFMALDLYKGNLLVGLPDILILIGMSFLCLIIPIFFLQQAIKNIGVTNYAIAASATPVCTFLLYSSYIQQFNAINFLISTLITLVLVTLKLFQK